MVAQWRREAVVELQSHRQRLVRGAVEPNVWDSTRTVSFHEEEHLHHQATSRMSGAFSQWWWAAQGWILAIAVGVCSSITGVCIDLGVKYISTVRFGYCASNPFLTLRACPQGDWEYWGDGPGALLAFLGTGTAMAVASATLVRFFAPAASGSGIPEVKTILNGFVMPDVVSLRTLCVKVPGLMLSVAAGMALGKEGPLVHVAVCWAQLLSGLFPQFQNEAKRRELFAAAAAAGVSTAFGAPLGGVLFSLEEVSSHFPSRTLIRAFTAAVSAAIMLTIAHTNGTKGITLFSVSYNTNSHVLEYLAFALLGVMGGLVGAVFNVVNVRWSAIRATHGFRKRVPRIAEVGLIAIVTLVTSWPLVLTRPLSADAIHALFMDCGPGTGHSDLRHYVGLCSAADHYADPTVALMATLFGAAAIRLFQTTLTFGTACPAGLFVPSLFTGACLGRCVGVAMQAMNSGHRLFPQDVEPGVYSMVGAAAVLGGVCRVTISLVAIMLELTGGLTYIVPFMLAVLVAKMVGDIFTEGIYDLYIVLKGYPFLKEELSTTFTERCCDIMDPILTKIDLSRHPRISELRSLLNNCDFQGFPVVNGSHFVGFISRPMLQELLDRCGEEDVDHGVSVEDALPLTDTHVMRMVPDASLAQAHRVFKQLGCKYIFLVGAKGNGPQDILQGMLTKKNFLFYLKSGKVGHMADHPSTVGPGREVLRPSSTASFLSRLLHPGRRWRLASCDRQSGADSPDEDDVSGSNPASQPPTPDVVAFRSLAA